MKLFNFILGAFLVFITLTFMRCNEVTEITELVKNTEKIQIVFYNGDHQDTYIDITDKSEIKNFGDFVDNKSTPILNCKYDGKIVFFLETNTPSGQKNSTSMEFSLSEDCKQVGYMYNQMWQTKNLTNEGYKYLLNLAAKQ